jgi:hypothetical protein
VIASVIKPRDLIRTQPYNQASPDVCLHRELKLRAVIELRDRPRPRSGHADRTCAADPKQRYPLTPIDCYLAWRRPDGTHLDPWLRTHERLGADIVKVASKSVVVAGTVAEWTEMALPEGGVYVVSGALVPIEIDREWDEGVYMEPNVWMVLHPFGPNPRLRQDAGMYLDADSRQLQTPRIVPDAPAPLRHGIATASCWLVRTPQPAEDLWSHVTYEVGSASKASWQVCEQK